MGYGRTSAKNGKVFSHVFNYPANYWDGASIAINHINDLNGGDLSGKKLRSYITTLLTEKNQSAPWKFSPKSMVMI
jgi:hypothetical protein